MNRLVIAIITFGVLAACEAGAPPTRPNEDVKSTGTGITLSGSARVGVVYRSD